MILETLVFIKMVKNKLVGAAGRYGARYGQHIKRRIAKIEEKQRKKQFCVFCSGLAKRLSKGIWTCKKCKRKFAAHAYFLEKDSIKIKVEKEKPKPIEQKEAKSEEKPKPLKDKKSKTKKKAITKTKTETKSKTKSKTKKK